MPRICRTTPRDENGRPVRVIDELSADKFVERLFEVEGDCEKSFTRYMTVNGYSSGTVVIDQPNQGLLKAALAEVHVLNGRANDGDTGAEEALMIIQSMVERRSRKELLVMTI